jgi:hypothetical protein
MTGNVLNIVLYGADRKYINNVKTGFIFYLIVMYVPGGR